MKTALRIERLEDRTTPAALTFGPFDTASVAGSVSPADTDTHTATLAAGDIVHLRIDTASVASGLASTLRVLDAGGTSLAFDDRLGGDGSLSFQADTAGTYSIIVAASGGTAGVYTLQARREAAPPTADLVGSSFRAGLSVAAVGEAVPIAFAVENRGAADAGNFSVEVVLADNNRFGPSSRVLTTLTRAQLVADANGRTFTSPAGLTVAIPGGESAGAKFLGVRIVPDVPESNAANNAGVHAGTDWQPLTIGDAVGLNRVVSGSVAPSATQTHSFTVTQDGRFTATVSDPFPRLTLTDAGGAVVTGSDAGEIDVHLTPGTYTLAVTGRAGTGAYRLATTFAAATPPGAVAGGAGTASVAVGDFNGDGRDDFATINRVEQTVSVFLGRGDGTFAPQTKLAGGARMWRISVGDANGDGRLDILTGDKGDNTASVFYGNGDGTFAPRLVIPAGIRAGGVIAADVNGDGVPDLVIDNYAEDTLYAVLGDSSGGFGPPLVIPTDDAGAFQGPTAVRVVDVTGDGIPDLIYGTYVGANVVVRPGIGNGTFGAERKYATGVGSYDPTPADFNGDGFLDLATVNTVENSVSVLLNRGDGTFAPAVNYAVGLDPYSMVAVDANGDGFADLVTSNRSANTVSILLGNGDGTFRPRSDIAVGTTPRRVAAGDFNGDGKIDLVTADLGDDAATVLLGNGDGTFTAGAERASPAPVLAPFSVLVADLNGDGRPDLATANRNDNSASVLLANADGSFQTRQTFAVDRNPFSVAAGDLNGDGVPELLTANYGGGSVTVLRGVGDGTFADRRNIPVGSSAYNVQVLDVNGDGFADIVVANKNDNNVGVLLGNGDLTFAPMATYPVANGPYRIAPADVNNDGITDLAVSHFSATVVDVLIGNGDGTFQPTRQFAVGSRPYGIAVADINGDGNPDVVTGNYRSGDVSLLFGDGAGNFSAPTRLPTGVAPVEVRIADVNGDGRRDIVTANYGGGNVSVMLGNGNGTFGAVQRFAAGSGPAALRVEDVDGDGRLDVVVGNRNASTVSVLHGNGDGTFAAPVAFGAARNRYSAVTAVVNGDGYPDVVKTSARENAVLVQLGTGTGSLGAEVRAATGLAPVAALVADFNGDGRPDIATADSDAGTVSVLLGNGDGTFGSRQSLAVGRSPRRLSATDFDGDGILDLAATDYNDGTVSVLLGNGDGTFAPRAAFAAGERPYGIVTDDTNGDGFADIVATDAANGTVSVLLGGGDGTFAPRTVLAAGRQPFAVALVDADGDGLLDITTADAFDNTVSILRNLGGGSFGVRQVFAAGARPYSLSVADVNGDGRPDLVTAEYGSDSVGVLLNDGAGGFGTRQAVPAGDQPVGATVADLNTDGRPDLVVVSNADREARVLLGGGFVPLTEATTVDLVNRPFLADLNGDGLADRIVLDRAGDVLFRAGVAGGQFAPPVTLNAGRPARDIALVQTAGGLALAAADARPSGGTFTVSLYTVGTTVTRTTAFAAAALPVRLAAVDLDGDGLDDLVAVNSLDNSVGIAIQRVDGTFAAPLRRAVGRSPSDVAFSDVDGDGRRDLLITGQASGDVTVLFNDAGHTFAGSARLPAGTSVSLPVSLASADFTGDGLDDIVVVNRGTHTLSVLANDGRGGFSAPSASRTTSTSDGLQANDRPGQVVAGDFNGDGRADLAVLMEDAGQLWVYLGNGDGSFRHTGTLPVGDQATGLRVVPGSAGRLDLLVGNGFGDVLQFEGKGDGTFQITGKRVSLSVIPDLTGTGQTVVLVANQQDNRVTVQTGGGDGYSTAGTLGGAGTQLAPGDVQWTQLRPAGQLPDPVVVSTGSNAVVVYRTAGIAGGLPIFDPNPLTYFVGTTPVSATPADVNGDGVPDLIVANRGSNDVSVIFGSYVGGEWVGTPGPRLRTGGAGPLSVTVRDQTGDGTPDLVVTNGASGTLTVLPGVGLGFFDDRSPLPLFDLGDSLAQAPSFVGTSTLAYAVTAAGRLVRFDLAVPGVSREMAGIDGVVAVRALATGQLVTAFADGSVKILSPAGDGLVVSAVLQTTGGQAIQPSAVEVVVGANGQFSVLVSSQGSDSVSVFTLAPPATPPAPTPTDVLAGAFVLSAGPVVGSVAGVSAVSAPLAGTASVGGTVSASGTAFAALTLGGGGTASFAIAGPTAGSSASGPAAASVVAASALPASSSAASGDGGERQIMAGLVSIQGSTYSTVALLDFGSRDDSGVGDGKERRPELSARHPFGSATDAERFIGGDEEAKERYRDELPERLDEVPDEGAADPWREDTFQPSIRRPANVPAPKPVQPPTTPKPTADAGRAGGVSPLMGVLLGMWGWRRRRRVDGGRGG